MPPRKRSSKPSPLRAVTADEPPADGQADEVQSVAEAAKGSQRELLVALRTRIAKTVDSPACPPRDLAALTRRLQEIGKEIAALDAEDEGSSSGESVEEEAFDSSAV